MIANGASERIKSSALKVLSDDRQAKRKLKRKTLLERVAIASIVIWLGGSIGFWIGGKVPLPNAIAQSEGNKVTAPKDSVTQPKLLRINLTLSDPSDLKVKQGNLLKVGDVISDRDEERKRLAAQRADYLATIKILSLPIAKPIEPLNIKKVPTLPDQSFAEIESNIDLQRIKVKSAQDKVAQQKQKLDLIETLNPRDLPSGTKEHESVKLSEFETAVKTEEARLNVELGKFESEKSGRSMRQYEQEQTEIRNALEKNRSLQEYSKALADYDRTEQERVFRVADLKTKVALVDEKLKEISTVRAQYASEVKRVRFVKQVNNNIDVELLLYVIDGDRGNKTTQSKRSTVEQPFNQESFTKPSTKP